MKIEIVVGKNSFKMFLFRKSLTINYYIHCSFNEYKVLEYFTINKKIKSFTIMNKKTRALSKGLYEKK